MACSHFVFLTFVFFSASRISGHNMDSCDSDSKDTRKDDKDATGLLQSRVKVHELSEGEEDVDLDTKLTNVPMLGNLTNAAFKDLDKEDSVVDLETSTGSHMKFKNAKGYKEANSTTVFVGETDDGQATLDMVKKGNDIFASIVNIADNTITQIAPDANDKIVVTTKKSDEYPDDAPPVDSGKDDFLLFEQGLLEVDQHTSVDDGSLIDVMVVWTHHAECARSSLPKGCTHTAQTKTNIEGTIELAIQESNTAFDLSTVLTDFRLVHMYRDPEGFDEKNGYSDSLNKITSKTDGFLDGVHAERDKYRADVVALIIQNPQYCGMAWLGPSKDRMFSVTGWNCATGYYSFAHEIMHNLGCHHDRGTTRACSNSKYNYGYRDPAGQFRSIMAYSCRTGQCDQIQKSGCTRVQRVSNPTTLYQGKPIGTATANNARRINDVRKIVAQYYDSGVPPPTTPPSTMAPTTLAPSTMPPTTAPPIGPTTSATLTCSSSASSGCVAKHTFPLPTQWTQIQLSITELVGDFGWSKEYVDVQVNGKTIGLRCSSDQDCKMTAKSTCATKLDISQHVAAGAVSVEVALDSTPQVNYCTPHVSAKVTLAAKVATSTVAPTIAPTTLPPTTAPPTMAPTTIAPPTMPPTTAPPTMAPPTTPPAPTTVPRLAVQVTKDSLRRAFQALAMDDGFLTRVMIKLQNSITPTPVSGAGDQSE